VLNQLTPIDRIQYKIILNVYKPALVTITRSKMVKNKSRN